MRCLCMYIITIFIVLIPDFVFANPLPFMPEKDEYKEITPVSSNELFGGITKGIDQIFAPIYSWGVSIITALFIIGTVVMIASIIFKNGQWQQYGQRTMLFSFVGMLLMRGMPILILSIQNSNDFDSLLNKVIDVLSYSTIYIGFVGIAVSFLFRFGHKLIEHPDFHRWSRHLLSVSIIMIMFAIIVPYVFPLI